MTQRRTETKAELLAMVEMAEKVIPQANAALEEQQRLNANLSIQIQVWKQAHAAALEAIKNGCRY
jgi:hypothetical protein